LERGSIFTKRNCVPLKLFACIYYLSHSKLPFTKTWAREDAEILVNWRIITEIGKKNNMNLSNN
jgi:hypothetical protein